MPVHVEKKGSVFRVVEPSGKVAKKGSKPVDSGGFKRKEKAVKQAQAINLNQRRKKGKKAPPKPK